MNPNAIKTTRREIDAIVQVLASMPESSRPLSLAQTALQNARMWLGEALLEAGFTTPYEDSLNPDNEKIAPPVDKATADDFTPKHDSHIKNIKEIRTMLVDAAEKVRQGILSGSNKRFYQMALNQAYVELCNARMWLGQELRRVAIENADIPG